MSNDLIATFSYSASGSMIAVTTESDPYDAVALARPSGYDNPADALAALGYRLASRQQAHSLGATMVDTGYIRLRVVPAV